MPKPKFRTSDFSKGAAALCNALMRSGLSKDGILMVARGCDSPCFTDWKITLRLFARLGFLRDFDSYHLLTEENLTNIQQTLREKGLIKEFSESLHVMDYFLTNFPNDIKVISVNESDSFADHWLNGELVKQIIAGEKPMSAYNERYEQCVRGIPGRYDYLLVTFIETVFADGPSKGMRKSSSSALEQRASIIADIYGPRAETICYSNQPNNQQVLAEAKDTLRPHVDEIIKILLAGIESPL